MDAKLDQLTELVTQPVRMQTDEPAAELSKLAALKATRSKYRVREQLDRGAAGSVRWAGRCSGL